jgi:Fur family ferric uptake transcriptional regulator
VTKSIASAEARLRGAGLRVTAARVAVLQALDEAGNHATVEQIRERVPDVSTQAVYDVLAALTSAGLARRLETPGHPARYELRADSHHHFICRRCGKTVDIDGAIGDTSCLSPDTMPAGFAIIEAEVTYWGTCDDCDPTARGDEVR